MDNPSAPGCSDGYKSLTDVERRRMARWHREQADIVDPDGPLLTSWSREVKPDDLIEFTVEAPPPGAPKPFYMELVSRSEMDRVEKSLAIVEQRMSERIRECEERIGHVNARVDRAKAALGQVAEVLTNHNERIGILELMHGL